MSSNEKTEIFTRVDLQSYIMNIKVTPSITLM